LFDAIAKDGRTVFLIADIY